MQYENRQPPEGINNVNQGWARDFILLVIGFFIGLGLLCWLLLQLVAWSAKWMPFSWEQALTQSWSVEENSTEQQYLQQLTEQLARAGGLTPEFIVQVRYSEEDPINAFATLGGNMMIFEGLVNAVNSEQGLAFVIAHEIAHIQHRHPVQAIARGLSMNLLAAMVFGQTDLTQVAGAGGNLALLNYSRQQENEADRWALQALHNHYGHVAGADELFRKLKEEKNGLVLPEWMSTHPDLDARIDNLQKIAQENNYSQQGRLLPLNLQKK